MMRSEHIIKCTADYFRIPEEMLRGRTRKREVIKAKHIAMCLIKENTDVTLREIYQRFNMKTHAAILHAVKSVHGQADIYKDYAEELDVLKKRICADEVEMKHDFVLNNGW